MRLKKRWLVAGMAVGAVALRRKLKRRRLEKKKLRNEPLVGEYCEIVSSKATRRRGKAEYHDGRRIKVRCGFDGGLERGEMARVVAYDARHDVFEVEPVDLN